MLCPSYISGRVYIFRESPSLWRSILGIPYVWMSSAFFPPNIIPYNTHCCVCIVILRNHWCVGGGCIRYHTNCLEGFSNYYWAIVRPWPTNYRGLAFKFLSFFLKDFDSHPTFYSRSRRGKGAKWRQYFIICFPVNFVVIK